MATLQKYPAKLPYKEFESWFFRHPNAHAQQIADIFGISVRTAYNKLASFNRRNHDINGFGMADAFRDSYKAGIQDERRLVEILLKAETKASLVTGIMIGLAAGVLLDEWIRGRSQMTIDGLFTKFQSMGINLADLKAQGIDIVICGSQPQSFAS